MTRDKDLLALMNDSAFTAGYTHFKMLNSHSRSWES